MTRSHGASKWCCAELLRTRFRLVKNATSADFCLGTCAPPCPEVGNGRYGFLYITTIAFPECPQNGCCHVQLWQELVPDRAEHACSIVAPYTHGIHAAGGLPPWVSLASTLRPVLLTFVGYSQRGKRAMFLRRFRAAANASAHPHPFDMPLARKRENGVNYTNAHEFHLWIWQEYARSVFSLQPPGDTPTRNGFYEAWLHGCIPVITEGSAEHYAALYNGMLFHSVRDLNRTAVVVSQKELYQDRLGPARLLRRLEAMPPAEVAARQHRMRVLAPVMQWNVGASTASAPHDAFASALLAARQIIRAPLQVLGAQVSGGKEKTAGGKAQTKAQHNKTMKQ